MAHESQARRLAVLSGKGGVGKTIITANLAAALSSRNRRVLVLDADLGLANLDVLLGIQTTRTLHDFLRGTHPLDAIIVQTPAGFDLLPAGSGILEGTVLTPTLAYKIENALRVLENRYDTILFDLGAGIGDIVLYFARLAHDILLVVTPEPTALTDVYAVLKVLALRYGRHDFALVVNQTASERPEHEGMKVASKLQKVVERFLIKEGRAPVYLHLMACIPTDPEVPLSVARRQLLDRSPAPSPARRAIQRLAEAHGPDGFLVIHRQH